MRGHARPGALRGARRFGPKPLAAAVAVGLVAAAFLVLSAAELPRRQREASLWVEHTLQVLEQASRLDADLATVVSEGRGFLLDRAADSAGRFETISRQVTDDLAGLRALTADNPAQQAALNRLDGLVAGRIEFLREIIGRLQAGDEDGATGLVRTRRGRMLMDQVRDVIQGIRAVERRLLDARDREKQRAERLTAASLVACGVLAAASGLFIAVLLIGRRRERAHLTELREGEAALRGLNEELERRAAEFQLLADNIPTLCWMALADGHIHWYNRRWHDYTGSDPEHQEGWGWDAAHDPDILPTVVGRWQRSLATGEPFEMTFPLRGADGVFRPFLTRVVPIRDAEGRITHWFGTSTDITAQREAERLIARHRDELEALVEDRTAKLSASEARYRMLAENTGDAITVLDLDLRRTYASPACRKLFGYEPERMLGLEPAATAHPDDRDEVYARLRRVAAGEAEQERVVNRIRHKQGHLVWVEGGFSLVRDAEGRPASIICTLRDVSERQAQADALRAANAELERLAGHLARARDQAERASRAKSRFLAGMSHELRTPLNGILGYAELLRMEGGLSTVQAARVGAMLGAGQHLLEMINGVLDLSEIEDGHVELRPAAIDLRAIADACLDLVRPAADAKGLALTMTMAPGTPSGMVADPTRLRQVLLNLLGNAMKFTDQGAVGLRLGAAGNRLRIEVADTGPGIPAERRHCLFQDFERLGAEAGAAEGAGLGLALSARLAALLGGRLGHEDNPGGGSVFWLELPLTAAGTAPAPTGAPVLDRPGLPDAEPASVTAAVPRLRVLVVDDVAMNRDIAGSFLRAAGHEITCAEDGAEAVASAQASDFDVILMDVRMAEMDGLEASRRIRALAGPRGQVPIMALTAQAFAEQVRECRQAGMDSHLAKPFTSDALREAVAHAAAAGRLRGGVGTVRRDADRPGAAAQMAAVPGSELRTFDPAAFGRTAAFLSPAALASYLETIAGRGEALLRALRAPGALASTGDLAEAAHMLTGSAGMFGFERLTTMARQFEHAVQTGAADVQTLIEGLAAAIEASLLEIPGRVPGGMAGTNDIHGIGELSRGVEGGR